jgi:hypothetical protein
MIHPLLQLATESNLHHAPLEKDCWTPWFTGKSQLKVLLTLGFLHGFREVAYKVEQVNHAIWYYIITVAGAESRRMKVMAELICWGIQLQWLWMPRWDSVPRVSILRNVE